MLQAYSRILLKVSQSLPLAFRPCLRVVTTKIRAGGESLLNAMNSFEMQSFDSIGGNLGSDITAAKSSLRNLIDLLRTSRFFC